MGFRALNRTRNAVLADRVERADTFLSRLTGLLGRKALPAEQGLWIEPCPQVHTFFMAFPIDVLFLDSDRNVVHVERSLKPWRISPLIRKSRSVLEMAAGAAESVSVGDAIDFESRN